MTKEQKELIRHYAAEIEEAAYDRGRYENEEYPPHGYAQSARNDLADAWERLNTVLSLL